MKRFLLLAVAVLIATAANAQIKRSELVQTPQRPNVQLNKAGVKMEEMQMRVPETTVVNAPKPADNVRVWYRRPAGAFTGMIVVENGTYAGMVYSPYLAVKPYSDYTFLGFAEGASDNAQYYWEVQHWALSEIGADEQIWTTVDGKDLTWQWGYEIDEVPQFNVIDNGEPYWWYLRGYEPNSPQNPGAATEHRGTLLSVPSTMDLWDMEILKSSKTFGFTSNQGQISPMTVISGPDPYGQNQKGWWLGKNGGMGNRCFDGIAQAFEKPEHPYLLKQVVMDCAVLEVASQVDMYCKIYKIDGIPPYMDDGVATLPEQPGELICRGRATLTPETNLETGGLVFFTLYDEEDGLEYEITPTIDDAILVVVDGYNDPEMENLIDFSAMIASNFNEDEGFGELAYLKVGVLDEEGNLDHYEWNGLNNFFSNHTMKTGITIFLTTELPYLTFYYPYEDGEYTFPKEGGVIPPIGDQCTSGIEFWSWVPSEDDAWEITCNGGEIPDWLTIELEDIMREGEFSGLVNAVVTADPLPDGMQYREAIVRFSFPGAYIDYKFMQGTNGPIIPPPFHFEYDVNGDGEVNIADVNALIYIILAGDTEANIAHLNELIAYILSRSNPLW